ncbi:hypothetical protein [Neptunicella sp. SCSIO 80796]|uniref:hypothetical protein n=1 Tax=Neptunicella plasticusilytica TaxID=3117012 RepID=UPI003A4E1F42
MQKATRFLKITIWILLFLLAVLACLLFLAIEKQPLVVAQSHQQVESADSLPALLDQLQRSLGRSRRLQSIQLKADQLNSLAGFVQRAKPAIKAQANLDYQRSLLAITYQLPDSLFGGYINVSLWIVEADELKLETLKIGQISIPGDTALSLLTWVIDWYTDSHIASELPNRITRVEMDPFKLMIKLAPVYDLLTEMKSLKRELNEEEQLFQESIVHYLHFLTGVKIIDLQLPYISINQYIVALFDEAQKRSVDRDPSVENRAAILAMAIFDGNQNFARFAGNIEPSLLDKAKSRHQVFLSRRRDLCQHFLYSAAIEILSQQGISIAVGEFKELMDRSTEGSGFSFADLSADMAGIKLAQMATDPEFASIIQQRITPQTKETDYFPFIADLPEGLHKEQFNQQIGDVDSEQYKQKRQLIEQRINSLPLFQN